ncbi:Zinc finger, PHD-type [Corchorus olitorius]|uniref:Zinc finger, PHD-type n=1 Tax=Corchorus olitorius TaxID=93759 RepID=A0A1R3FV50_9ROSI|nr:Zinc finger, PHD-type [Corchorus olitorius]
MELQHFSHSHPLVFNEEPNNDKAKCLGCGDVVLGPSFNCKACGFYLDQKCAEAPSELVHPFHRNHNLNLLNRNPNGGESVCNFCYKNCENFIYHCSSSSSCQLNLHIKCALFLYNLVEKKNRKPQIAHIDPLSSTEFHSKEPKETNCFVCWKPLLDSTYLSLDFGFYLHKKCIELPLEINHLCHRQHSLFFQFNSEHLPCQICQETHGCEFVYYCSPCKFAIHIGCESPPPIIEDTRNHEHPFTRWLRPYPFICDACGIEGNYESYTCSTCCLVLHKKCISLPHIIKSVWHHHPIFHKYFVVDNECGPLECGMCHEEVNTVHGSYYCSECKFIVHVNCVLNDISGSYYKVDLEDVYHLYQLLASYAMVPSFDVIRKINLGENVIDTEIKHFSHEHNLLLSHDEVEDERYCDGCSLLIITSFYHCLQCDFFLHKSCVDELPKKEQIWLHFHQEPLNLVPNRIFVCNACKLACTGFAYRGETCCFYTICVRCAKISFARTSEGHMHLLLLYGSYSQGQCNACGISTGGNFFTYRCKGCNFNLHDGCAIHFPEVVAHQCDQHYLKLTYHEDNDYSEYLYCDICEERRNPNNWFYHCAICNTSSHHQCVLKFDTNFIKRGTKIFVESVHAHPLVFKQKVYDYPEPCSKCGQRCLDLALECLEASCTYIIHWKCNAICHPKLFIELYSCSTMLKSGS